MKQLIERYIKYCLTSENKLEKYVDNRHIALVFCEVYEFVGYHESGEHTELFEPHDFISSVGVVFANVELTDSVVRDTYQTICEKKNPLRNLMKLILIEDNGDIMHKRVSYSRFEICEGFEKKFT